MTDKKMQILSMDDANFAADFVEAIGAKPGDNIVFSTPQFDRIDDIEPIANPSQLFGMLHAMPEKTLRAVGMLPWDGRLWLFPYQWFALIPQGLPVECIDGEKLAWDNATCDDDMRYGALAYGIVPEFAKRIAIMEPCK